MSVSFTDAVERLLLFVEACPEFHKEFNNPRYYHEIRRPDFFPVGKLPGTWAEPCQLTPEALKEMAKCFLRYLIKAGTFTAVKENGEKHCIGWNLDIGDLVYRLGTGQLGKQQVDDSAIFFDKAEFDLFFSLGVPGRKLVFDWEAAYILAEKKPEPIWKYVVRQCENPPDLPTLVEHYRTGLAEDLGRYPARMLGKLKLYTWDAVKAWAEKHHIPIPEIKSYAEREAECEFLSLDQTQEFLAERLKTTREDIEHEIAAWIYYGELKGYTNVNELGDQRRFRFPSDWDEWKTNDYFDPERPYDYLPLLECCFFKQEDIFSFTPKDRYITGTALVARWEKRRGSKIKALGKIISCTQESRLHGFHPICHGTRADDSGDSDFSPIELGLFCLKHIEDIEAADFSKPSISPGTTPTPESAHEAHQDVERTPATQPQTDTEKPAESPAVAASRTQDKPVSSPQDTNQGNQEGKSQLEEVYLTTSPIIPPERGKAWTEKAKLLASAWRKVEAACREAGEPVVISDIPGTREEFYALVKWLEPKLERKIKTISTFQDEYLTPCGYRFPRKMKSGEHSWKEIFSEFSE